MKEDGTPFATRCLGSTRIHYAGSYKMREIEIIVDPEYLVATKDELVAAGLAPESMVKEQEDYYRQMAEDQKVWDAHLLELSSKRNENTPVEVNFKKIEKTESEAAVLQESTMQDQKKREEHMTVRDHVGYYDFTHKLLEVTGLDARSFLSRLFVGAVAKAQIGQAKYTTMLNEEGLIIDDVIVFRIGEDRFWVSTLYMEELIQWFNIHKTYEDISYQDITEKVTMYAVQGPASRAVLNEILDHSVEMLNPFWICDRKVGEIPVKVARSGYTGELGYEIYCDPADVAELEKKLEEAGAKYGIKKIETDVIVTSLPREKGFVLMSDLQGLNPLEAGFGWSVDWNKKFIGKEALEKANRTGVSRELLGFTVEGNVLIDVNAEVWVKGERSGRVTVSVYGYSVGKTIGFALVEKEKAQIGDKAVILSAGKEIPALLCERVFYDPNNDRIKEKNILDLEKKAILAEALLRKNQVQARKEHEAVRNHVGYYDFTHKLLEVTGLDARSFLSRLFVGPIAKIEIGRGKYTTMLNERGTIIDDVIVFRIEEDTFWVSTLYIEELMKWMEGHCIYEDVSWREITEEVTMYAVQGPDSGKLLNDFLREPVNSLKNFEIRNNFAQMIPVKVARSGFTGELGYEIYCRPQDAQSLTKTLEEYGENYGLVQIRTDVTVTSLPREKGFVLMSDLAGLNPLEAGLGWSVDWDKEFIGKAALLNAKDKGIKRILIGFTMEDDTASIETGASVWLNGEKIGKVTTFTYGYTVAANIGFAVVDAAKGKLGERVEIESKEGRYGAVLCERVFYAACK